MPKLWTETVDAHRQAVREAVMNATAALVAERGLRAVTMSEIAEHARIGRATLYKYFSDVEAILRAWHERQINAHLEHLAGVREHGRDPDERLEAVLRAYAVIAHATRGHHDTELGAFLHRDGQVARAEQRLSDLIGELVREGAKTGTVRDDIPASELATYCVHALSAAGALPSNAAAMRLVDLTLSALRRPAQ